MRYPCFCCACASTAFAWVLLTILLFSLGTNFYPYFYSHYIAALTCLFVLIGVVGLERLSRWNPAGRAHSAVSLRGAFRLLVRAPLLPRQRALRCDDAVRNLGRHQSWRSRRTHRDPPATRTPQPGQQLVFVRYWPQHQFQEWVHNAADIDGARIVWARDLGPDENQKLLRYYPNRTAWLLQPDARPPLLARPIRAEATIRSAPCGPGSWRYIRSFARVFVSAARE